PLSSLWALRALFAGFVIVGSHWSPPRPPSDDVTTPMCMSWTGGNSAFPLAQVPSVAAVIPLGLLFASRQFGETSRVIMSGTARARSACLSPIDAELSIMKRRSILSTDWLCTTAVKFVLTWGAALVTGRERQ